MHESKQNLLVLNSVRFIVHCLLLSTYQELIPKRFFIKLYATKLIKKIKKNLQYFLINLVQYYDLPCLYQSEF